MHLGKQIKLETGLSEADRTPVVKILNTLLADEYVLYAKTRNYHWNVTGPQFNDLHKFFETQYEQLYEIIDNVAERAHTLGGNSIATLGVDFLGIIQKLLIFSLLLLKMRSQAYIDSYLI